MIALTTLSLLTVCLRPADGSSASPPAHQPAVDPGPHAVGTAPAISPPKQAGPWTRPDAPKLVTAETIFDYMDGAGELYLAYRFDHLDVYEYSAPDRSLGTITVELYWMKRSDDAFGLLSTDWGGEPIDLRGRAGGRAVTPAEAGPRPPAGSPPAIPAHTALYGGGLLRFWSGDLYGRVMATRESPQSREQVLALAQSVVRTRPGNDGPPEFLSRIPARLGGRLVVRPERTCFFRSHLVLNSMHYVAPGDVLGLGSTVDAATTEYTQGTSGAGPVRVIQVRYPTPGAAAAALRSFLDSYVSSPTAPAAAGTGTGMVRSEEAWVGWAARDRWVVIVIGARDAAAASELASSVLAALAAE